MLEEMNKALKLLKRLKTIREVAASIEPGKVDSWIRGVVGIGKFGRLSKSKAKAMKAIKQLNLPKGTVDNIEDSLRNAKSAEDYKKIVKTLKDAGSEEIDKLDWGTGPVDETIGNFKEAIRIVDNLAKE